MFEGVREVGEFYQSWLGIAVCHGAPASLVMSMGRKYPVHSAQLEGPVQSELRSASEFVRYPPPPSPFLPKSEGLGRLLSS